MRTTKIRRLDILPDPDPEPDPQARDLHSVPSESAPGQADRLALKQNLWLVSLRLPLVILRQLLQLDQLLQAFATESAVGEISQFRLIIHAFSPWLL